MESIILLVIAVGFAFGVGYLGHTRKIGFGRKFVISLFNVFIGLIAVICFTSFTQASYGNNNQRNHREDCHDTISFFGKPIVMDDWTSIHHQIRVIASEDDMLSYESGIHNRTLSVGKVKFGVNIDGDGIILISSTEVDAPKMKQVVAYLKGIYGAPEEDEPDNYWWYVGREGGYHGKTVRMRPLHSEEGGTVLLFY